ncbi:MAG: GTPase ObgE [Proteobacteria bacterium]|jgi:GTP-binding protein|nr:GTPase ObgE [Pseudomonadota bacterium]
MQFIDEATLYVKAGDGGDGVIAFRREKFMPNGGPAGGDGGRGGDVTLRADRNLSTLLDLRYRHRLIAGSGDNGGGRDCHGRGAKALVVRVPLGTAVFDADGGAPIGDLVAHDQELVVARGGAGGQGNMRFTTPSNRAPRKATPGEPGEERTIRLELKLLADVGLVGLPNVGKSSIISRLSAAKPRIADYPFTTLVPNLGVVEIDRGASFVMADIPGLIRGASTGAGLGLRFLRHIQRTAVLLYVLAKDAAGEGDLLDDLEALRAEVAAFDPGLATRARLVVLNKADLPDTRDAEPALRAGLASLGETLLVCSAATGEGLDAVKAALVAALAARDREEEEKKAGG